MKLLVAVPTCVALAALAGPIANAFGTPQAAWPLRGMAIVVLTQGLFLFVTGAFEALGRISINLRIVAPRASSRARRWSCWWLSGTGATGAAFGRAIGYSVGVGIALAFIWRVVGRRAARGRAAQRPQRPRHRPLRGGAADHRRHLPALLADRRAADRRAAERRPRGRPVRDPDHDRLVPALPRRRHRRRRWRPDWRASARIGHPTSTLFARALRYIVAVQGIFLAPIVVWAEPILVHLLGAKYRDSADVLRALAPFVLLAGPAMLVSVGGQLHGRGAPAHPAGAVRC